MVTLTETFSKILGKEFDLVDAPCGSTDCNTFFRVPLMDPEAYVILEHEISHPFSETDLDLTEAFRDKAVEGLLLRAGMVVSQPEAKPYKQKLDGLFHHLWNVLEDWRCCSVWGELYPGGASLLRQRWKDIAKWDMEEQAKKDLITYLGRLAAGTDTPDAPPEFQACAPHMLKARSRVELVDNKACLALTSKLVEDIADELLKQYPPDQPQTPRQSQMSKLQLIAQACGNEGDEGKGHGDPEDNPLGGKDLQKEIDPATNSPKSKRINAKQMLEIRKLIAASDKEEEGDGEDGDEEAKKSPLQKLIDAGTKKMFAKIQAAKQELGKAKKGRKKGEEDILLQAAKVSGIRASIVTPAKKLPRPTTGAAHMRKYLENVKMRRELRPSWEGVDLDMDAFIQAKIAKKLHETRLFKEERRYGGIDLLLLIDVSGSMHGHGMDMVEQAIANVAFACAGLNVRLKVWAFSSELFFFSKVGSPKEVPNMTMAMTSMVQALDAAWEWARTSKSDRAVLMITDGYPTSCRARKSKGTPVEDLHEVLRLMRRDENVVSVLAIGSSDKAYYDEAFGKNKYGLVNQIPDLVKALQESARVMIEAHLMGQ
jgi:nitric oxide reductase activation protein